MTVAYSPNIQTLWVNSARKKAPCSRYTALCTPKPPSCRKNL